MTYRIEPLTDPAVARTFLNQDRALATYAIGDLDPAFWPASAFYGAFEPAESARDADREMAAVLLLYHGLEPSILVAFGAPDAVRVIMAALDLPEEVYYLWLPELAAVLDEFYHRDSEHVEWRMVLDADSFAPPQLGDVRIITPDMAETLSALYQEAAGPGESIVAFDPWQIAHGVFYGVWQGGELVATAGTHVYSPTEKVAAIGNVFTRPEFRGRGYATACTAAVVRDALAAGLDTIVLNVKIENTPAIRVYEKLGFRRYAQFLEGPAFRVRG